jgi:uncharacterized protein (TIGR02246 family)
MTPRILTLVGVGLLAGCTDSPEATAVDTRNGSLTSAEASVSATTGQEIEALRDAWDAAWEAKDAAAYARSYTVESELVTPLGGILAGREAIRAQHEFLFTGPFAGSSSTSEIRRTVFLERETRMVDLDVTLTGYAALPPGLVETEPGVVRTRIKWIIVERQGGWKILAQQITGVVAAP